VKCIDKHKQTRIFDKKKIIVERVFAFSQQNDHMFTEYSASIEFFKCDMLSVSIHTLS